MWATRHRYRAIIRRIAIGRAEFLDSGGEELGRLFPEKTARLKLHLKTRVDADAEAAGSAELAKALGVRVPESWPPVFVAPPTNEVGGWGTCYLIHTRAGEVPNLIGMAGAARWAPEKRTVQVGTSVVSEFYGQRIGEEVVGALAEWALRQPDVDQVVCDVPADHAASAKSLERAGYVRSAAAPKVGYLRFVRKRQ